MIGNFIIGAIIFIVGVWVGVFTTAINTAAKKADEQAERYIKEHEHDKEI